VVEADRLVARDINQREWYSALTPDKLKVVSIKPESLSLRGLHSYIDYLNSSGQDSGRYQLAFWRKLVQPLGVAVMVVLALSFIFGPLRTVTMGSRILMGVAAGFSFYVLEQLLGPMALVYQLPPWLGAFTPPVVTLIIALLLLRRRA
jgi:lipopolysaccharide export system permease protein